MRQRPVTAPQKTTSMARENSHEGRPSSSMGASNVIEELGGLESTFTTSIEEKEDSTISNVKEEEEEGLILPNMEEIKEFSEEIEQILPSDFDFGK